MRLILKLQSSYESISANSIIDLHLDITTEGYYAVQEYLPEVLERRIKSNITNNIFDRLMRSKLVAVTMGKELGVLREEIKKLIDDKSHSPKKRLKL